MVEYYKGSKNFQFKLKNLEVTEEFAIWQSWDNKGQEIRDVDGNIIQFPVNKGILKDNEGRGHEVKELKYMKGVEFKEKFPRLQKSTRYVRMISVAGSDYAMRFSSSVNAKLNSLIDNLQAMQVNPLDVVYEQYFDASKRPADMYSIQVVKKEPSSSPPVLNTETETTSTVSSAVSYHGVQYSRPASTAPIVGLGTAKALEDREREILDAIRGAFGADAEEARFISVFTQNGVKEERAREIFKDFYKKK